MFICLDMEMEQVVDRLKIRHQGHQGLVDILKVRQMVMIFHLKIPKIVILESIITIWDIVRVRGKGLSGH